MSRITFIRSLSTAALALCVSATAFAAPLTYTFTGVMADGYGFDGQTVSGQVTVDPSFYNATYTDGTGFLQSYIGNGDHAPAGSAVGGQLALSGGLNFAFGPPPSWSTISETYVYKNSTNPSLPANQFIVDASSAIGNDVYFIQLRTSNDSSPQAIFPNAAATDLSPGQAVVFNTPGSSNLGYFAILHAEGGIDAADFFITSVTVVPEPASNLLMAMGLGMLGLAVRRARA